MEVSLIVSYYKGQKNLELICAALALQSEKNFELIVAEDDNDPDTESFLQSFRAKYTFPIVLVSQDKDDGFRKNEMLNRAILKAKGDKVCFIDGDCIPHRHFIRAYNKKIRTGIICFGRRVNLGEKLTMELYRTKNLGLLKTARLMFSDSGRVKEAFYLPFSLKFKNAGLLGCNWGVLKSHLIDVNGFDEDYTSAGVGEDVDIEWRLKAKGLTMYSMKNKAIVYHLYHPRGYSEEGVQINYGKLKEKQLNGHVFCKNGLKKIND